MPQNKTIAVAMSGGVDSSTVAAMLRAEGHDVIGLTMQLWNQRRLAGHPGMPEAVQGRCCSLDDVYDARRVAETLGIGTRAEYASALEFGARSAGDLELAFYGHATEAAHRANSNPRDHSHGGGEKPGSCSAASLGWRASFRTACKEK